MGEGQLAAVEVQDAALSFEAVKTFVRQSKDGVVLGLAINPEEVPADLYTAPVGSRYYATIVQIGDNEEPVKPPRITSAKKAVAMAHMMCRDERFQRWMDKSNYCLTPSEEDARAGILAACGIESRGDLAHNEKARESFFELVDEFKEAVGRGEV